MLIGDVVVENVSTSGYSPNRDSYWTIKVGASGTREQFNRKSDAVSRAKQLAKQQSGRVNLKIKNKDGTIGRTIEYEGEDPGVGSFDDILEF